MYCSFDRENLIGNKIFFDEKTTMVLLFFCFLSRISLLVFPLKKIIKSIGYSFLKTEQPRLNRGCFLRDKLAFYVSWIISWGNCVFLTNQLISTFDCQFSSARVF